jgi:hypothetical protein
MHMGGQHLQGADAVVAAIQQICGNRTWQQHFLGNVEIELDGDAAAASTYLIATYTTSQAADRPRRGYGTYRDQLERRPAGWQLVERTLQLGGPQ